MTEALTVIARIEAQPQHADALGQALAALVEPTRREPGCLAYELHRSLDNPALFFFHETWASRPQLEAHWASPHLAAYRQAAEGMVAQRDIQVLRRLA